MIQRRSQSKQFLFFKVVVLVIALFATVVTITSLKTNSGNTSTFFEALTGASAQTSK